MSHHLPCKAPQGLLMTLNRSAQKVLPSMRGMKSGAASRVGADLRTPEATCGNDYSMPTDNKQLVALLGLEDTDFWVQDA